MSAEPLKPGEQRLHEHPEAGQFYVRHMWADAPRGRPFFTNGRYYASEQEAVDGFFAQCAAGSESGADTRTADRIDGYDRDDLGESPDF